MSLAQTRCKRIGSQYIPRANIRRNYFTREQCPACWVLWPSYGWVHSACGRGKNEHLDLIERREAFKLTLRQSEGDIAALTAAAIDELMWRYR